MARGWGLAPADQSHATHRAGPESCRGASGVTDGKGLAPAETCRADADAASLLYHMGRVCLLLELAEPVEMPWCEPVETAWCEPCRPWSAPACKIGKGL